MVPLLLLALLGCSSDPDVDGDGFAASVDCDDADGSVFPGAGERCNGLDDDCDAEVDEDPIDGAVFYADADGDGYAGQTHAVAACELPAGYQPFADDCDDGDGTVHPDAAELCDGLDNDCDDFVDEGISDPPTWYADADEDGWGDPDTVLATCTPPDGYVDNALDCDDADPDARPDGTWYVDADGDGLGSDVAITGCPPETGAAPTGGDCDDTDAGVYPGAVETCDGVDQDCDGAVDEDAAEGLSWYADLDGDGWGDPAAAQVACEAPADHVDRDGDCAPEDEDRYPGAEEVCGDGVDQDCNGVADNTCAEERAAHDLASVVVEGPALSPWTVGRSAAAVDLDGDGQLDLAVGAPSHDLDDDADLGRAWLLHGPLSGVLAHDESVAEIGGESDGDAVATRILGLPDLAGRPALVLSAPGWDDPERMRGNVGAVGIFFGMPEGALLLEDADVFVQGHQGSGEVGASGLDFGDLDGDGTLDLVLGSPSDTDGRGAVFLAYGPLTSSLSTQDLARLDGEGTGLGLGDAAAAGGDHDGDGIGDLLVGASAWRGQAFLWYGPVTGDEDSDEADVILEGETLGSRLGERVAQGDLDGDGYADVLLAGPGTPGSAGEVEAGVLRVHRSDAAGVEADWVLEVAGTAAETFLGSSDYGLLFADVDADGHADLGWGLPHADLAGSNSGVVGLLYGPVAGALDVDRADLLLTGPGTTAYLGTDLSLATVDGAPEALVLGSLYGDALGGEALLVPVDALR